MRVETSQNMIPQSIITTTRKIALPLYDHKLESDRTGKHLKWTKEQNIVLTGLAILTDLGFNSVAIIPFFFGYPWQAAILAALLVKAGYNISAEKVPPIITDLKNKIKSTNKLS